jgi:hypothetical protein
MGAPSFHGWICRVRPLLCQALSQLSQPLTFYLLSGNDLASAPEQRDQGYLTAAI